MNAKHEEEIYEKYKILFEPEEIRTDEMKSCMAWGFEYGDGWYDLTIKMLDELMAVKDPAFKFYQAKEKWGELTIYYSSSKDEVDEIIDRYKELSRVTCEACGKPGTFNTRGWVKVRCSECQSKEG